MRPFASTLNRNILNLAIPALATLLIEPFFRAIDSAMIGHLGVDQLAGLSVGSAILQTTVGLMIFLAYSTTPSVARHFGLGNIARALASGINGCWLALTLGSIIAFASGILTPFLIGIFPVTAEVSQYATTYFVTSLWGVPAMLGIFAATGLLRGLQNTKTPLKISIAGLIINVALNATFIYVFQWGLFGAAFGTVLTQWILFGMYVSLIVKHARQLNVSLMPRKQGLFRLAHVGMWLFIRTASLRAALLFATFSASQEGSNSLAAFHIVMVMFSTLAFGLDSLAIAAQALVGKELGRSNKDGVRLILRRMLLWGVSAGTVAGIAVIVASPLIATLFTSQREISDLLIVPLIIIGLSTPLSGVVYVLDGVLIGAGDARYLAITGITNLMSFIVLFLTVSSLIPETTVVSLTLSFGFGFLGARALTLSLRAKGNKWIRTGAPSNL